MGVSSIVILSCFVLLCHTQSGNERYEISSIVVSGGGVTTTVHPIPHACRSAAARVLILCVREVNLLHVWGEGCEDMGYDTASRKHEQIAMRTD